jgi:hypothetical protein
MSDGGGDPRIRQALELLAAFCIGIFLLAATFMVVALMVGVARSVL